ncbi:hypothetical protein NOF55_20070 [Rhizobiaceae bacterium BDR2-2]|uniref:Nitrate reductase n=1 Tax=Ectorhizobium quercum TaxID=2965071 RepID=A0AAE3N1T4_9HYPH|nr:hypothetical protein [Ectorhizobium quercum]MCX8999408.1 hypothetical protein [Ectorhizobium quercum]
MSGGFSNLLARGTSGVVGKARAIKQWTRVLLALPEDAVVSVNELACHLPGCPPKETVVLVMRDGETTQVSIHKAMLDLAEDDIADAFSAIGRPQGSYAAGRFGGPGTG